MIIEQQNRITLYIRALQNRDLIGASIILTQLRRDCTDNVIKQLLLKDDDVINNGVINCSNNKRLYREIN